MEALYWTESNEDYKSGSQRELRMEVVIMNVDVRMTQTKYKQKKSDRRPQNLLNQGRVCMRSTDIFKY
jgi:hypothetical protein